MSLRSSDPTRGFPCFASADLVNMDLLACRSAVRLRRYRYTSTGERIDNITDWAERKFRERYGPRPASPRTRSSPMSMPRCTTRCGARPMRSTSSGSSRAFRFTTTSGAGPAGGSGCSTCTSATRRWSRGRWCGRTCRTPSARAAGLAPRPILKADRAAGVLILDSETRLDGVPAEAWAYRLGNRTALDWVLDQHKEKTPKDPTIRARFNSYRFADHKERVADLLARVTRVSVETVAIVEAMRAASRPAGRAA